VSQRMNAELLVQRGLSRNMWPVELADWCAEWTGAEGRAPGEFQRRTSRCCSSATGTPKACTRRLFAIDVAPEGSMTDEDHRRSRPRAFAGTWIV
jgi:hypothetical protein